MSPAVPFPRVIIPGVPPANVSLLQSTKVFEGNREVYETSYPCDQIKTSRGHLTASPATRVKKRFLHWLLEQIAR
jgi:hypothetical protein